jgi:hypothetical protein
MKILRRKDTNISCDIPTYVFLSFQEIVHFHFWLITPWPESARHYRPNNHSLSAKLVLTFAYRGCHVVIVTDPYCPILGFLDRNRYFFFHVAPQLYSRGLVDPVSDPLLLRKSGSAWNRTRTSGFVARNLTTRPQWRSFFRLIFYRYEPISQ